MKCPTCGTTSQWTDESFEQRHNEREELKTLRVYCNQITAKYDAVIYDLQTVTIDRDHYKMLVNTVPDVATLVTSPAHADYWVVPAKEMKRMQKRLDDMAEVAEIRLKSWEILNDTICRVINRPTLSTECDACEGTGVIAEMDNAPCSKCEGVKREA